VTLKTPKVRHAPFLLRLVEEAAADGRKRFSSGKEKVMRDRRERTTTG
jgi:hypothetical protein